MDELNQHECMATMTALIKHMQRNQILPKEEEVSFSANLSFSLNTVHWHRIKKEHLITRTKPHSLSYKHDFCCSSFTLSLLSHSVKIWGYFILLFNVILNVSFQGSMPRTLLPWMKFLHDKLGNPSVSLNIRLFLAKLIINTEEVSDLLFLWVFFASPLKTVSPLKSPQQI